MPAKKLFRAATIVCLFISVGCQSTGNRSLWQTFSNDPQADLKDPERLHLAYATLSEQTGDYATARESYETALRQNQQTEEAILGLARLDLLAGRHAEAERRFIEAVEVAPKSPLTNEALGQFYLTQNRYTEAAVQLQRGLTVTPGNKRLRHKLGIALARGGNIVAAEPQFVQAVGNAEADYNIGLILYEQGHTAEAEQRFLQAVPKSQHSLRLSTGSTPCVRNTRQKDCWPPLPLDRALRLSPPHDRNHRLRHPPCLLQHKFQQPATFHHRPPALFQRLDRLPHPSLLHIHRA